MTPKPIKYASITSISLMLLAAPACTCFSYANRDRETTSNPASISVSTQPEPTVILATSASSCDWPGAGDLQLVIRNDIALLKNKLPTTKWVNGTNAFELITAINQAETDRGLLLFFTGHGRERWTDTRNISEICIGEALDIHDIVAKISARQFPWAVLVLSACQSAFVDVASSQIPISVISASPFLVEAPRNGPSFLLEALLDSYQRAKGNSISATDENCDGYLSDREWFELAQSSSSFRFQVAKQVEQGFATFQPEFRLRRQSPSEIPIFRLTESDERCRPKREAIHRIASQITDENLAHAITAQLNLAPRVLPAHAFDYFFYDGVESESNLRAIESTLPQLRRLPLNVDRKAAKALAQFVSFADIFDISYEQSHLFISRMRDDKTLEVVAPGSSSLLVSRIGTWARFGDGDQIVRFARQFDSSTLPTEFEELAHHRTVSVCPTMEGQCFWLKGQP